jgi:hypothetical protein
MAGMARDRDSARMLDIGKRALAGGACVTVAFVVHVTLLFARVVEQCANRLRMCSHMHSMHEVHVTVYMVHRVRIGTRVRADARECLWH